MKLILSGLIIALVISACKPQHRDEERSDTPRAEVATPDRLISGDSLFKLLYAVPQSDSLTKTSNFNTLDEFPQTWLSLHNSEFGPVIYKRITDPSQLMIRNDSIIDISDEITKSRLTGFKKIGASQYHLSSEKGSMSYTFDILDEISMLTLVSWTVYNNDQLVGDAERLYVPKQKEHLFKHIDEPSRNVPGSSLDLSEFNIDSVKANYRH
jgi:hypothetical protein